MFKPIISGLIGLVIGGVIVWQAKPSPSTHDLMEEIFNEDFSNWYEFHMAGALTLPNHDTRDENGSKFQVYRRTHLYSLSSDDIEAICFAYKDAENDQTIDQLGIRLYVKQDSAYKMGTALIPAEGHDLSFEFNREVMMKMQYKAGAFDRYGSFRQMTFHDEPAPFDLLADIEFKTGINKSDKVSALLDFAHYFSPTKVPTGCSATFDTSKIPDWAKTVAYKWNLTSENQSNATTDD